MQIISINNFRTPSGGGVHQFILAWPFPEKNTGGKKNSDIGKGFVPVRFNKEERIPHSPRGGFGAELNFTKTSRRRNGTFRRAPRSRRVDWRSRVETERSRRADWRSRVETERSGSAHPTSTFNLAPSTWNLKYGTWNFPPYNYLLKPRDICNWTTVVLSGIIAPLVRPLTMFEGQVYIKKIPG
jgi:hypothetical protein